jgi:glycosyltransferase involved in cell wall biosynthesis
VFDYRDVWQDHPWWPAPRWRRSLEEWLERRLQSAADLVVANHDPMERAFRERLPRIADRCIVIPNGFDPEELGAPVNPSWRPGERFEIVYAGTLYGPVGNDHGGAETLSVQRPMHFFQALRLLVDRGVFGPGGVRATFVGAKEGTGEIDRMMECARECGVANIVQVVPRLAKSQVVPILRRAHLLLNIIYDTEAQVTQKIYDYMHLEIPVLTLLRASEINLDIVRRAGAGPAVDPTDRDAIASAIEGILRDYASGRPPIASDRTLIDRFDVRVQARYLDARLRDLVPRQPESHGSGPHV